MTYFKPLTPELRGQILNGIDSNITELRTCKSNAYVNSQITALHALRAVVRGLPDGIAIPIKDER